MRALPTWRQMHADTPPDIEAVQFARLRGLSAARKLAMLRGLGQAAFQLAYLGLRRRHPEEREDELRHRLAGMMHGREWAARLHADPVPEPNLPLTPPDPTRITRGVTSVLESLEVPYLIAGSLASIIHGLVRTTVDATIVAAIGPRHAPLFTRRLARSFWLAPDGRLPAIRQAGRLVLIHRQSGFRVDVVVQEERPFDRARLGRRASEGLVEEPARCAWVASAEDSVLAGLEEVERAGRVAEGPWRGALGVIKIQAGALDVAYLRHWAAALDVAPLLELALAEGRREE